MGFDFYLNKIQQCISNGNLSDLFEDSSVYVLPYQNYLYCEEAVCLISYYIDKTGKLNEAVHAIKDMITKWICEGTSGIYKSYMASSAFIKLESKGFTTRIIDRKTINNIHNAVVINKNGLQRDVSIYDKNISMWDAIIKKEYFTRQIFGYGILNFEFS